MKSILQNEKKCILCGKNGGAWGLDLHHVFFGSLRKKSDKHGLTVWLCHDTCHLNGVHKDTRLNRKLQAFAQVKAMEHYGWSTEDFIKEFYKNYLE